MDILKIIFVILAIWSIPWKLYAVWMAAKHEHRKWFIALVLINTFAILELIYLFFILKKTWLEVKEDFKSGWKRFKAELGLKTEEEPKASE